MHDPLWLKALSLIKHSTSDINKLNFIHKKLREYDEQNKTDEGIVISQQLISFLNSQTKDHVIFFIE